MSHFFIDRPILAWVVAILVVLAGAAALLRLPIAQYPTIAPPTISINATYPGASAQAAEESVTQIIEQNMTSLDGLLYIRSNSDSTGAINVALTFASGTNPDIAQVQVQNKLQTALPLLPGIVQQQGITVSKQNASFLLVIGLASESESLTAADMADYAATHLVDPLSRVPGVGSVQLFGSKYAMRIWLDADRLKAYALTPADVAAAVTAQNAQVSVGELGGTPAVPGQQLNATITAQGRLHSAEQFRDIVLRPGPAGSVLRLGDVARVELAATDYSFVVRYNGRPATGLAVLLATDANALTTARGVATLMRQLERSFPPGLKLVFPYDTTPFVRASIREIVKTLVEAIALVVLVMYVFLQDLRATVIPTIAIPVVLFGTFGVLSVLGYSLNMLTMFAMVLAIGLLVDDAIVVVENVERLMSEEGLTPLAATRKSMGQITGALVGIATVLAAVFLPMAFLRGSSGVIYRQFSVTIVAAMLLSVLVALILTPALCATLLRPTTQRREAASSGLLHGFNSAFARGSSRYRGIVASLLRHRGRALLVFGALVAVLVVLFWRLPSSFLPSEDQGYLVTLVQAPPGATQERTLKALDQTAAYFRDHEKDTVDSYFMVQGFSFSGSGQNNGIGFILLKSWDERRSAAASVNAIAGRAFAALSQIKDALVFPIAPPALPELSNIGGFDFYLRDDNGQGHDALVAARNQLLGAAAGSKLLAGVRPNGSADAPQFRIDIDPLKVATLGVSMRDVNDTLAIAWGGRYIDDFIDRGRVKRVYLQADAPFRMNPEDLGRWYARNNSGAMVPVAALAASHWTYGPPQLARFNGVAALEVNGEAAPGVSSGAAMGEIEKLAGRLPPGFSVAWTGQSYEERAAGAQTPALYALSLIVIFLCLAALYESWLIPVAILLAVPLGVVGAVLATTVRGLESDIFFQVAMLTTIGLATKNSILIVEFAEANVRAGLDLVEATLHAVRDRLRPILMTSLAFGLGVLPLVVASGAGAGAQRAIGTGVVGGVIAGTFLGLLFIPVLYVSVLWFLGRRTAGAIPP